MCVKRATGASNEEYEVDSEVLVLSEHLEKASLDCGDGHLLVIQDRHSPL